MTQEEINFEVRPEDHAFDLNAGLAARDLGLVVTAKTRHEVLAKAQRIALDLGRILSEVTADDVYRELLEEDIALLGPAAGAIFRAGPWTWTGKWFQSCRTSNHGRMIRVWRLR